MTDPILIAGAGIGGLGVALALARQGIACRIIERAPEIREVGAGIQLGPNGFRAFERLGVAEAMDAISFRPKCVRLIDSVDGVELSRQTLGAPFEARPAYFRANRCGLQTLETGNCSRSAISPGPVGRHPNFLCVCSLEAGMSRPANMPSQPKKAWASCGAMDLTGSFKRRPMASAISRIDTPSSATAWYFAFGSALSIASL